MRVRLLGLCRTASSSSGPVLSGAIAVADTGLKLDVPLKPQNDIGEPDFPGIDPEVDSVFPGCKAPSTHNFMKGDYLGFHVLAYIPERCFALKLIRIIETDLKSVVVIQIPSHDELQNG